METDTATPDTTAPSRPALVLDTNVVLDWLVFRDARAARLSVALEAGTVRWVACAGMREEFRRTLGYASLARWQPDIERALTSFDKHHHPCPAPPATGLAWRCSDPDDQVFIDLALAQRARWLVTHDRALHRLARRARAAGLLLLKPSEWRDPAEVSA